MMMKNLTKASFRMLHLLSYRPILLIFMHKNTHIPVLYTVEFAVLSPI